MSRYDVWQKVKDLYAAREIIFTGWGTKIAKLPPDDWLFNLFDGWGGKVLDFGCGVGRNTFALAKRNREVVGFDFPSMISLFRQEKGDPPSNVRLETDWNKVKKEQFDVVVATLVFQHIHQEDLLSYLNDMSRMAKAICLHSRIRDDFSGPKIPTTIQKQWLFTKVFYPVDGTIDDILRMGPEDHFSGKLEPRV